MKRIKIILPVILITLIPFSLVTGQEKKTQEKVKIIVADDSGTRTVIDTTFSAVKEIDSLRLKDGSVIFFGKDPENEDIFAIPGTKHIVIKSPGGGAGKKEVREVTVISSDSTNLVSNKSDGDNNFIVIARSGDEKEGHYSRHKVITRVEKKGEKEGTQYIYIDGDNEEDWSFESDQDEETDNTDKTRNVIAKNGIVVSIEGEDEAKIKELTELIRQNLEIAGDSGKSTEKKSEKAADKNK